MADAKYSALRDDTAGPYSGLVPQSNIVQGRPAVVAASTQINFPAGKLCGCFTIFAEVDDLYVDWTNTQAATVGTSFPKIAKGTSFTYMGPPISGFTYIGGSATGNLSYIGW